MIFIFAAKVAILILQMLSVIYYKQLICMISKLYVMKKRMKKSLLILLLMFVSITGLIASDGTEINSGATAWMLTSTALVLLMVPGLAMFYGGLVRSKNVLGTVMHLS